MKLAKETRTKVLIIGAGPSGSMAAYRLAQLGFSDFIMVDRTAFPRLKPCAGGISPIAVKFLRNIGLEELLDAVPSGSDMHSVRVIGPNGSDNVFTSGLKARIFNRSMFDKAMLDRAVAAGARFVPGFYVRDLLTDGEGNITGATDGLRKIYSDATVMATGGHVRGMREKYFFDRRPLGLLASRIGWWEGLHLPEGSLEMIFDRELLPHYGWAFPEGNGVVNIGICMYEKNLGGKSIARVFDDFIDKYYADRLKHARQAVRPVSYPINVCSRVKQVAGRRMLLCGEAGRMCNPATAEGISFALESGYLAGDAIAGAWNGASFDYEKMYAYEERCCRAFNSRLMLSSGFSRIAGTGFFNALLGFASSSIGRKIGKFAMPG